MSAHNNLDSIMDAPGPLINSEENVEKSKNMMRPREMVKSELTNLENKSKSTYVDMKLSGSNNGL